MTSPVVANLLELASTMRTTDVRGLPDADVMGDTVGLEELRKLLDSHVCDLIGELDARGTTDIVDGLKTQAWLVREANISAAAASSRLLVGRRLRLELPVTADALADGKISFDHAAVLARAWNERVADDLAQVEGHLIAEAQYLAFKPWTQLVKQVIATLDQDGSYDPDQDLPRNKLTINLAGDELIIDATLLGDNRAIVEHTLNTVADELFRQYTTDQKLTGIDPPARTVLQALALVEVCRRAHAVDLNSTRPGNTEATVVIDGNQLGADLPEMSDSNGDPLQVPGRPTGSVLRLACCADLKAIIVDGRGLPIDHGRWIRTATIAQKRILKVRDGLCAFPGCNKPHAWTDAHHINQWDRDQGETNIKNLVSLCRHHHGVVHRNGWTVQLTPDGWAIFGTPDGRTFWGQRHGRQREGPPPL